MPDKDLTVTHYTQEEGGQIHPLSMRGTKVRQSTLERLRLSRKRNSKKVEVPLQLPNGMELLIEAHTLYLYGGHHWDCINGMTG